jgi:hypothetical protein
MPKWRTIVVVMLALAGCSEDAPKSAGNSGGAAGTAGGSGGAGALQQCAWDCHEITAAPDTCMCDRRYHFSYGCITSSTSSDQTPVAACPAKSCCLAQVLDQSAEYDQMAEVCLCTDDTAEQCQTKVQRETAAGHLIRAVEHCAVD